MCCLTNYGVSVIKTLPVIFFMLIQCSDFKETLYLCQILKCDDISGSKLNLLCNNTQDSCDGTFNSFLNVPILCSNEAVLKCLRIGHFSFAFLSSQEMCLQNLGGKAFCLHVQFPQLVCLIVLHKGIFLFVFGSNEISSALQSSHASMAAIHTFVMK